MSACSSWVTLRHHLPTSSTICVRDLVAKVPAVGGVRGCLKIDNAAACLLTWKSFMLNGLYIPVYFDQDTEVGVVLYLVNRAPENRGAELEV